MAHALVRRIAAPFVVGSALAGALAFGGQPAVAAPPAPATICSVVHSALEFTGTHVVAEKFRICNDGTIIDLNVTLQRQNPSTGAWATVATGLGAAGYQCQGTATRRYRVGTSGSGTAFKCT